MLQIILNVVRAVGRIVPRTDEPDEAQLWRADPLAHPALRTMSATELADLPISHPVLPGNVRGCEP